MIIDFEIKLCSVFYSSSLCSSASHSLAQTGEPALAFYSFLLAIRRYFASYLCRAAARWLGLAELLDDLGFCVGRRKGRSFSF